MKYFTPKRYVAFNSRDRVVANRANDEWEQALTDYRQHLKKINGRLIKSVKAFVKSRSLHDADYRGWGKKSLPGGLAELGILAVKMRRQRFVIFYQLVGEPSERHPVTAKVFETTRPQWLYDEFDVTDAGDMTHEILFSNGTVLKFCFSHFSIFELRSGVRLTAILGSLNKWHQVVQ